MQRMVVLSLSAWFCFSCSGKDDSNDPGSTNDALCAGEGPSSLEIGYGSGAEFWPYEAGESVGLAPAPQGGYGVWVRARTSGIRAQEGDTPHATSAVLLETYIDGEKVGSFLNETVEVYCQEDGKGLLWDVAVGFDPEIYSTNDDLLSLNGEAVMLLVEATDADGRISSGTVDVVIEVGK